MNKYYVAENLEDLLQADQAADQVRFIGDTSHDPYLNQRSITTEGTDKDTFIARILFLQSLGIRTGEILWNGPAKPNYLDLVSWTLPRKATCSP
jgi:hypothetical protein